MDKFEKNVWIGVLLREAKSHIHDVACMVTDKKKDESGRGWRVAPP